MLTLIDAPSRTLTLKLEDGKSARRALEIAFDLLRNKPYLWDWDWIVEAQRVPDDASVQQIADLARIQPITGRQAITTLVSQDRYLHLWARVMDFQFPSRTHRVVGTIAAARAAIRLHGRALGRPCPED